MEKSIKSTSINYGVLLGVFLVLVTVTAYALKIELLVNLWLTLLILPLIITAFGILSTAKARSILKGFISFKQSFSSYFITVAIGIIISTIVSVILFNFIDPDAAIQIKSIVIEKSTALMERFGAPESEINKAIAEMESQDTFALGTQLRSLAQSLLFFTVIGLLVALIMKKKDPNEA